MKQKPNIINFMPLRFIYFIPLLLALGCKQSNEKKNEDMNSAESGQEKEEKKTAGSSDGQSGNAPPVLVIHGGAGNITRDYLSENKAEDYRAKLKEALDTGYAVLEAGGSATDAVESTIHVMENAPLFNAGKGAVFTHDEKNEMDASIMRGKDKNAGGVAGVTTIKNPITGARAVMEDSKHVLLAREGAVEFAEEQGVETVDPAYFKVERRLKQLRERKKEQQQEAYLDVESERRPEGPEHGAVDRDAPPSDDKFGTVGAVALDKEGNLAAGTSTGGMTNKRYARIGDSPIIGAGTYADNRTCAVSATGHGEFFMRNVVAYDIAAVMDYQGRSLKAAADTVINEKLKDFGGDGGVIALDADGHFTMTFNTSGMFRGYKHSEGSDVGIFEK